MNNISAVDFSFPLADLSDLHLDFSLPLDNGSSVSSSTIDSPRTPSATGTPRPFPHFRRPLPDALFGVSLSQFACGFTSGTTTVPCSRRVCMVYRHHVARARSVGDTSDQVVRCSRSGCRFVDPCFSHFVSAAPVRSGRRARYLEYYTLIRRRVMEGSLTVPPPLPAAFFGVFLGY